MVKIMFFVADFLYRHSVTIDNVTTEVEILDTSRCEVSFYNNLHLSIMTPIKS